MLGTKLTEYHEPSSRHKYPTACRYNRLDGKIAAIDCGYDFLSGGFGGTVDSTTLAATLNSVEINTIPLNKVYSRA